MSDTPETDAKATLQNLKVALEEVSKLARILKEERDEAREDTPWHSNGETKDEWLSRQREKYAVLERERDEAREALKASAELLCFFFEKAGITRKDLEERLGAAK